MSAVSPAWAVAARLLPLVVALALPACGPADERLVITVAGTAAPNTPGEATWLDFKREVEEASGGAMRLRPLIYGQLGSEEQLLSGLRRGRIQFANLSAQMVSTLVPELALLYAPYLFADEAEADHIYDRYLTAVYRDLLADHDLHLLSWYEIGFNQIYGRRPILRPTDLRGVRFRVSSALNARLFAEALGADVIPLGYGDIVPSLQTGLIAAGENSVSLYARTGIAGEAPYLTLTNHAFGVSVIVAGRRWWETLTAEQRQIIAASFPTAAETRHAIRAQTAADLAAAATLGIVVHAPTTGERAAWQQATAAVPDRLIPALGGRAAEIYALILRARAEYRAGSGQ